MRFLIVVVFIFFLAITANAQSFADSLTKAASLWKDSGVFSLGIGQTSFTNWAAGGDNNINLNMSILYDLNYKKDIVNWNTNFDSKYGTMIFFGKKPQKTNDQIHMSSKLGYEIDSIWSFSMLFNFDSQFSNGYKYPNDSIPISRFMAPAYFMMGMGVDYKPNPSLSVLFTPFSNRITIVNDAELANKGAYGVDAAVLDSNGNILYSGRRFKNEPGGFLKIQFLHSFNKNFNFTTRIEFFSSYFNNPTSIDVRWNINSMYRLSKRAAVGFSLDLIYDEDAQIKEDINGDGVLEVVGPRTQVKETLSLGVTMNW